MVLGLAEGSMLNLAFMKTRSPIMVVVSFPLQTRFISLRKSSCIDCPSAEPETMDHSPCILARSFFSVSASWAQMRERVAAVSQITRANLIVFITELLESKHRGRRSASAEFVSDILERARPGR